MPIIISRFSVMVGALFTRKSYRASVSRVTRLMIEPVWRRSK